MIEADAPSTEEVVCRLAERARPTGGSHGRTTRGPAQRVEGAKRRPRQGGVPKSAAKVSIKAGARKPRPDRPGDASEGASIPPGVMCCVRVHPRGNKVSFYSRPKRARERAEGIGTGQSERPEPRRTLARQWQAMGRIELTLLDGDAAPTDLRPSLAPTLYHKK